MVIKHHTQLYIYTQHSAIAFYRYYVYVLCWKNITIELQIMLLGTTEWLYCYTVIAIMPQGRAIVHNSESLHPHHCHHPPKKILNAIQ